MKRLTLVLTLITLTAAVTGCQQGRCRLRGAKCRPGMSMPTYAQPPAQPSAQPPGAPCNTGYPPPGYMPNAGYMPGGGYMPSGGYGGGYSGGYMPSEGTVSGDVVVQEFPTAPIEGQTQVLQRPIIESVDEGDVITIPGPEMGPLPNG
jgi:hypothetical protein